MFDIGGTELLLIAVVALVVIGPKDLPRVLRVIGQYTGKARAMTRHLRSGFDEMIRQAELEEMEKKWAEHNRRIMEQTPTAYDYAPQISNSPTQATSEAATDPASEAVTNAPEAATDPEVPPMDPPLPETLSSEIPPLADSPGVEGQSKQA